MKLLETGSCPLPVYQLHPPINSLCHASGDHSVLGRAINVGYTTVVSTVRRLATMVHPRKVPRYTTSSRLTRPAQTVPQVWYSDRRSHSDGVVSCASGFDELERMLDAHRRDRSHTKTSSPRSRNFIDSPAEVDNCLPGLAGVWFQQGRHHGEVDLGRAPKHGWFEMYAEKTG